MVKVLLRTYFEYLIAYAIMVVPKEQMSTGPKANVALQLDPTALHRVMKPPGDPFKMYAHS